MRWGGGQPNWGNPKYGRPSHRRRGWRDHRGLLEPCGFLLLRLDSENNPENKRRKEKSERQKKVRRRGEGWARRSSDVTLWLLPAVVVSTEERKGGNSARRVGLALCQMSSLALMVYMVFAYHEADVFAQEKVEFTWWNAATAFSRWHLWGGLWSYCLPRCHYLEQISSNSHT